MSQTVFINRDFICHINNDNDQFLEQLTPAAVDGMYCASALSTSSPYSYFKLLFWFLLFTY